MAEVKIEKLGRQGDGIFFENGREVFVPYSLPDDMLEIAGKGPRRSISKIVQPSANRIAAVCKHFGTCGGCQLQHMNEQAYEGWKLGLLEDALQKVGITEKPDRLVSYPVASRRKAVFSANRKDGELQFGFTKAGSNDLVSIDECPVLDALLQQELTNLTAFAASLPLGGRPNRISVLATDNGMDVNVEDIRIKSDVQQRALVRKALDLGFARLSLDGEQIIEARKPVLTMGKASIVPPPGAFVQAIEAVEKDMTELVSKHLSDAKKVADLYCGIGTFALRLAEKSQVWALEDNEAAINSLDRAWRETAGELKQLSSEVRNLERRPASFKELKKMDGLVFDPPRAGAELQSMQIAKSRVSRVAAVSCNPTTLARDLAILLDGGYTIKEIVAFDQFRFTHHLETIVLLEK